MEKRERGRNQIVHCPNVSKIIMDFYPLGSNPIGFLTISFEKVSIAKPKLKVDDEKIM